MTNVVAVATIHNPLAIWTVLARPFLSSDADWFISQFLDGYFDEQILKPVVVAYAHVCVNQVKNKNYK